MQKSKLVIVGGGLFAALITQRLGTGCDLCIEIIEAEPEAFGQHTWSFHMTDVTADDLTWLSPLIAHRWSSQTVRFRSYERRLDTGYATLTSDSVRSAFRDKSYVTIRPGIKALDVQPRCVTLANGEVVHADCVIDARGYRHSDALRLGYQKFVGLEVEVEGGHGLVEPVIMDATVDQRDGYRFMYLLPFSSSRVLIEDTRYADGAILDELEIEFAIHAYAYAQGWTSLTVIRRERGVLPIALAFDARRYWSEAAQNVPQAGMRAALFHPTTGYSLPDAVKVANIVAMAWPVGSERLSDLVRNHALGLHRQQWFYRLLNRMLFLAARPDRRHLILQRFYRLPKALIERFYSGQTTRGDIIRMLSGKPPVPISRALACLSEKSLFKAEQL